MVDWLGTYVCKPLVFDSVVVVTDRRILDQQICDTIRQYTQVRATVAHAEHSGDLRRFIEQGKKIIISTVQKFPVIVDKIGNGQRGRSFAIIIDEAHSSQGGKASAAMSRTLGEEETDEDRINRLMASRKLLPNVSYYAFTATPKNKTLEAFGDPEPQGDDTVRHRPFHVYSMKQAIQEGFILDVLQYYTPVNSYYKLAKTVAGDPEFDARKARKKLRRYVEEHQHAIRYKVEIMVDHFLEQVIAQRKIGGKARAMVDHQRHLAGRSVCPRHPRLPEGVQEPLSGHCSLFWRIRQRKDNRSHPQRVPVVLDCRGVSGGALPFPGVRRQVPGRLRRTPAPHHVRGQGPLRGQGGPDPFPSQPRPRQEARCFCAGLPERHGNHQGGFLPVLPHHHPRRRDRPRQTPRPPGPPGPCPGVRSGSVAACVRHYLDGVERDQLDPMLNQCVAVYRSDLDEDAQVAFKTKAKAFVRACAFLFSILPCNNRDWKERSIFLNLLIPKLSAPVEEDLSKGILETIDMDSYRPEKKAMQAILLKDEDAEIDPVAGEGSGRQREAELDLLSNIIANFNDLFGGIQWADQDRVLKMIEDVCHSILRELGESIPKRKDVQGLYSALKKPLGLSPDRSDIDPRIAGDVRQVLSGLFTVTAGTGSLRTHGGDAHGRERGSARLDARIARLSIHAASTLALFLIETWQRKKTGSTR